VTIAPTGSITGTVPSVTKPFVSYKWRWASYQCTESLNDPHIYIGVLRALRRHEGSRSNDSALAADLAGVSAALTARGITVDVDLARTDKRNLLRNSQQYWKSLGVLSKTSPGGIELTQLGRDLADGGITPEEFCAITIKTLELPNPRIENSEYISTWRDHLPSVKPLELILQVLIDMQGSGAESYLTAEELFKVIIPLFIVIRSPADLAKHVVNFRVNPSAYSTLPNCVPEDNDPRIAREFLLFLSEYGVLHHAAVASGQKNRFRERFVLRPAQAAQVATLLSLTIPATTPSVVASTISTNDALVTVDRVKRMTEILARPQQSKFRRLVLSACGNKCLITGEQLPEVLRACHIIEVRDRGSDDVSNGISLRSDLHDLFDAGHLRISADGRLHFSAAMEASAVYSRLPRILTIPSHVSIAAIQNRFDLG